MAQIAFIIVIIYIIFTIALTFYKKSTERFTGPEIFEADNTNIFGLHDHVYLEPVYRKVTMPSYL